MELGAYLVQCCAVTSTEIMRALEEQKKGGGLIGEILVKQGSIQKEVVHAALEKQKTVRAQKAQEASSIRVDAGKLESLIDLVGELVIAGANVLQLSQKAGSGALVESASGVYRLVEELREIALSVRMVPIGETFTRFQRVVRDISKELGKEISLVISGARRSWTRRSSRRSMTRWSTSSGTRSTTGSRRRRSANSAGSRPRERSGSTPTTTRGRSSSRSRTTAAASTANGSSRRPSSAG